MSHKNDDEPVEYNSFGFSNTWRDIPLYAVFIPLAGALWVKDKVGGLFQRKSKAAKLGAVILAAIAMTGASCPSTPPTPNPGPPITLDLAALAAKFCPQSDPASIALACAGTPTLACVVTACSGATPAPSSTPTAFGPTPSPSAGSIATPTPAPTVEPAPTDGRALPPPVESFRGGLSTEDQKGPDGTVVKVIPWKQAGRRMCAGGDSTIWYYMTGGVLTCDPRTKDRSPCDGDHMACPAVRTNCSGRGWDDVRGADITAAGNDANVIRDENNFGFSVCAGPGPLVLTWCPREDFRACADPSSRAENCAPVPLTVRSGDGCTRKSFVVPAAPTPAPRPKGGK